MRAIAIILGAGGLFLIIRHRSTARSITKNADRTTWAQASDTRYPRYPRASLFGRKRGIR